MKPTPPGWPRISTSLYYDDAAKAIDWLCDAFGFEVRIKVEADDGRIEHSELEFVDGLVMVSGTEKASKKRAQVVGGYPRAKGATIVSEPKVSDYGEDYWSDRGYECVDPGGHHWWFAQRLRSPKPKA